MRQLSKQFVYVILVFMILSGIYALVVNPFQEKKEVSLSELVLQINDGKIEKITVQDNDIEAVLKDGGVETSHTDSEAGITETFRNYGVDPEKLKAVKLDVEGTSALNIWLGVILPIAGPVLLIAFFIWFSARQLKQGGRQAVTFGQSRARIIQPDNLEGRVLFKDVAGAKEAKEELVEIVDFLRSPKKFFDIGARIPRGVLLMGAPGTGKTLLARAVAGEAGVPFFHLSGSEFVEMFVGVGAARVRDLFKMVKKAAPAIIFIDEIDAVGRHRGSGLGGGHDEREQTLNQILVEMDGFETNESVIVMAATNRPDVLDPALLRPGRFDRRVILDEPDLADREEILKIHAKNKPLPEKEKKITAYHEAGHALVAHELPHTDPVHKISIISRGRAGGYTLKLPMTEKHYLAKSELVENLAVMLAGQVAEQEIFGDITTGASSDLRQATQLARKIVTQYGMSETLGPRTFGEKEEMIFLGREIHEQR